MSFVNRDTGKPLRTFTRGANCCWFMPDNDAMAAPPPLVLFLHGQGERGSGGTDLQQVCRWGLPKFRSVGTPLADAPFPFLVIAPQCPPQRFWHDDDMQAAIERLLDNVVSEGLVDPDQLFVAGFSMGGIGSFCLALRNPSRIAALVSVCGRCPLPESLAGLATLPMWIAYAEDDEFSELTEGSQLAIDVLSPFGKLVKRTYRLGAIDGLSAHVRTADAAFADHELYRWLARQRRPVAPAIAQASMRP